MRDNKSSESEVWGILSAILAFVGMLVLLSWRISSSSLEGFQSSRGSGSDATRVYAVFDRATVNYWTKDCLDTLKVKYGTEIAEPLIEEWTREYLDVSYVRYRQGVAVNPLNGKVYIYSSSSSTRKERVETPVKSTRYVYSWIVPIWTSTVYRKTGERSVRLFCRLAKLRSLYFQLLTLTTTIPIISALFLAIVAFVLRVRIWVYQR